MISSIFILISALFGYLLFNLFFQKPKNLNDSLFSLFFSLSVGLFFSTWFTYLVSLFIGFNQFSILLSIFLLSLILILKREKLSINFNFKKIEKSLFFVFLFFVLFVVLNYLSFEYKNGAYYSIGNTWGDYPFHISLITSIANGNFPPNYTIFNAPLKYPFLSDYLSSILLMLGTSLSFSIIIPNIIYSLSLVFFIYYFGKLFVGPAAPILLILFLLNGNFAYFYSLDYSKDIMNAPNNGIQFMNSIVSIFLPQRSALFGFCISLLIYILLYYFVEQKDEQKLLLAMVLLGLLPMFHAHSFVYVTIVTFFLFLFHPSKKWLLPLVIAFALSLPQILSMQQQTNSGFFTINIGWLVNSTNLLEILIFWIKNTGLLFLLIPFAFHHSKDQLKKWYIPSIFAFLIANLISFQPYVWDNIKLFIHWYLFSAMIVSPWIYSIYKKSKLTALFLIFVCIFSAILSNAWLLQSSAELYTKNNLQTAEWIMKNTPENSVFLTSSTHKHPVLLAGRKVVMGYPGWLWTHGFNYSQTIVDVNKMFAGDLKLIKQYNVSYVYVGLDEIKYNVSEKIKENLVYSNGVNIYQINKLE